MTETNNLSTEAKVELMVSKLKKSKNLADRFREQFEAEWQLHGHPIQHWRSYFKIHVDHSNISPSLCLEMNLKVLELHQEASYYFAAASAYADYLKDGSEQAYFSEFHKIHERFKSQGLKIPPAHTLQMMSKVENEEYELAASYTQMEMKFWKQCLADLAHARKSLEQAGMNMATELKAEGATNWLERQNARRNGHE